ncbi:hypothetical protein HUJ04_009126 [Dendroctonus ponderosae]|nr:hypothetical protein HUJ04_009126 [Dendroctonus ponderosae]
MSNDVWPIEVSEPLKSSGPVLQHRSAGVAAFQAVRDRLLFAVDLDLSQDNVQDAFVIAVEQQARERLERLSALRKITPIDITELSEQLNQQTVVTSEDLNGFINNSPIYVTSLTATESLNNNPTGSRSGGALGTTTSVVAVHRSAGGDKYRPPPLLANDIRAPAAPEHISAVALLANHIGSQNSGAGTRRSSSPYANGRTELLIGEDNNKLKTSTGSVESNNNKLNIENEIQQSLMTKQQSWHQTHFPDAFHVNNKPEDLPDVINQAIDVTEQ